MVNMFGLAQALDEARDAAALLLTDTVELWRPEEAVTVDELGTEHRSPGLVWPLDGETGRGLVQDTSTSRTELMVRAADAPTDTTGYAVKLPLDCPVQAGDEVRVTASLTAVHVGRSWRVMTVPTQGWQLLYRCPADLVEEREP